MTRANRALRALYDLHIRKRLRNRTFTLISSNCNGGFILRDLGVRFNTPFIGLMVPPGDYITLCRDLERYLACDLTFLSSEESGLPYPVGKLHNIKIFFAHYASAREAETAWETRKRRVDLNNIFFLFSDRGGCTYDMLRAFDALPYENKAIFCNREYPEIASARCIPGFEHGDCVGPCYEYTGPFTWRKYYDAFDYVSWFNGDMQSG